MSERDEFSVYQFFPNDTYERVLSFVDGKTAVEKAKSLTETVGGRLGTIVRVIITDGDDYSEGEHTMEQKLAAGLSFDMPFAAIQRAL